MLETKGSIWKKPGISAYFCNVATLPLKNIDNYTLVLLVGCCKILDDRETPKNFFLITKGHFSQKKSPKTLLREKDPEKRP